MQDTVSLRHIIREVLQEHYGKNIVEEETDIRHLQRAFERFVTSLGGNTDLIKNTHGRYEFEQDEVPFIKLILSKLDRNHEIFDIILKDRQRNKKFSSQDVNNLILSLFDEAECNDENKTEIEELAKFCCKVFLAAPLRALEKCHATIDALWSTVQDLSYEEQSAYLYEVADMLEAELIRSHTESAINIRDTAEMAISYNSSHRDTPYDGYPSDIQYDYLQRDRNILLRIQEDEGLRRYIETLFQRKAEDIFGYTTIINV